MQAFQSLYNGKEVEKDVFWGGFWKQSASESVSGAQQGCHLPVDDFCHMMSSRN
jgi:hypothetical protein